MKVSVEKVTKRFTLRGTPAVFDASFAAVEGGITTLLGPSGSGKTTLLRIVAGLEATDEGHVRFEDQDVTHLPVRERGVGFVFQSFALFNHMTVRRNIAFALEVRKTSEAEKRARVDELLALVQLEGFGERYPRQLSGGQRQRVGFARALAFRPQILLLDEPFGALDTRVRVELREWLVRLHETTPLTTLLVTHDQEEALELSQRIVVMHEGRVAQVGTPSEVYDRPQTPFVASFVGTSNVLQGRVEGERFTLGSMSVSVPSGVPDGAGAQAIVRPHDVRLVKADKSDAQRDVAQKGQVGTITRIAPLGGHVKLQLSLPWNDAVTVQLSRGEAERLNLLVGDEVIVDLAQAKVFIEDYAI